MSREYIIQKAEALRRQYKTDNPFAIAEESGVLVRFADLGSLCGMYKVILRNRFVVLNSALSQPMQRIVLAHELGHDRLHRSIVTTDMTTQSELYDLSCQPEFEANLFAAALLIDAPAAEEMLRGGQTVEQVAKSMQLSPELISIYFGKGLPYRSDFLKNHDF